MKITNNFEEMEQDPTPPPKVIVLEAAADPLVVGEDLKSIFFAIGKVKKMVDMLYVYAVQYETAIEESKKDVINNPTSKYFADSKQ